MPTVLRPELPPEIDDVFGRVLAKGPDERYGSCREFVEAARMALGVFGTGTEPCTAPASGISGVAFQTFPDQQALYNAYMAKVVSLNSGHQFKQNSPSASASVK